MVQPRNTPQNSDDNIKKQFDTSWEQLCDLIFAPLHEWPNGSLFSHENIRQKAKELVEMFENLSIIELSHTEVDDIRKFARDFNTYLQVLEAGPSNRGHNSAILSRTFRALHKASPFVTQFVNTTRRALDNLVIQCEAIARESLLAQTYRDTDENISLRQFRFKQTIDLSPGTALGNDLLQLRELAEYELIKIIESKSQHRSSFDTYTPVQNQQHPNDGISRAS